MLILNTDIIHNILHFSIFQSKLCTQFRWLFICKHFKMCSFCRWSVFSSSKKPQASRSHCPSWCFKTLHFLSSLGEVSSIYTCYFFLLLPQDLLFILLILHAFFLSPLTCHMPCKTHRTWFRQYNIFCPNTLPSVECHSVQFFSIKVFT